MGSLRRGPRHPESTKERRGEDCGGSAAMVCFHRSPAFLMDVPVTATFARNPPSMVLETSGEPPWGLPLRATK